MTGEKNKKNSNHSWNLNPGKSYDGFKSHNSTQTMSCSICCLNPTSRERTLIVNSLCRKVNIWRVRRDHYLSAAKLNAESWHLIKKNRCFKDVQDWITRLHFSPRSLDKHRRYTCCVYQSHSSGIIYKPWIKNLIPQPCTCHGFVQVRYSSYAA